MPIDPNDPAFPVSECRDCGTQHKSVGHELTGLSKRELFAAMAMQGLLAARNGFLVDIGTESVGSYAVRCADGLLAELNKEPIPEPADAE